MNRSLLMLLSPVVFPAVLTAGTVREVHLTGRLRQNGVPGSFDLRADSAGRFRQELAAGLTTVQGFDGSRGWGVDWSGNVSRLDLGELATNRVLALVATGLWRTATDSLEMSALTSTADDGATHTLRLRGEPQEFRIQVDEATETIRELKWESVGGTLRALFTDFREVAPQVNAPHRFEIRSGSSEPNTTYEVAETHAEAHANPSSFARPVSSAAPLQWDAQQPRELALVRAQTGHLLVEASIEGNAPRWFILDTGAETHAISATYADSLKLPIAGRSELASIVGNSEAGIRKARALRVGAVTLPGPHLVEMDLAPFSAAFGRELAGIIGAGLFRRVVAEVNLSQDRLRLHETPPEEYAHARWYPLRFDHGHPVLEGRTSHGAAGWFRVDLGASGPAVGNAIFTAPTTQRLGLESLGETTRVEYGPYTFALGELPWIECAGQRFEKKQVAYSLDDTGIFSDASTLGNIGADLLKDFRVVLDYPNERMALLPTR